MLHRAGRLAAPKQACPSTPPSTLPFIPPPTLPPTHPPTPPSTLHPPLRPPTHPPTHPPTTRLLRRARQLAPPSTPPDSARSADDEIGRDRAAPPADADTTKGCEPSEPQQRGGAPQRGGVAGGAWGAGPAQAARCIRGALGRAREAGREAHRRLRAARAAPLRAPVEPASDAACWEDAAEERPHPHPNPHPHLAP